MHRNLVIDRERSARVVRCTGRRPRGGPMGSPLRVVRLGLLLGVIAGCGGDDDGDGTVPIDAPTIDAPDIDAPDIDAPDIDAPDIDAPDIDAPDIDAPDI